MPSPCSLVNRKKSAAASSIGARLLRVVILEVAQVATTLPLLLLLSPTKLQMDLLSPPYHTKNALPLRCDGKEEDDVGHVA